MKLANMSFPLMLLIRVSQGVFALLVIILSGYVANWYRTATAFPSPSQVNFLIFGGAWSFISLACIELLPRFLPRIPKPYIAAPLDLTNALFHLAGFAALAGFLGGLLFCHGDVCHAAQAAAAFSAFSFAVWSASAALTYLEALKIRRGGVPAGSGGGVPVKKEAV
ncbi:membrane-associating domain-containing protein [Chaetomium sp. MPI-CAGE-AT-0009]|nr:membrane-associating domain-containing protein [Chaetomium sp. MPI-CAGE-AT-0009]